MKTMTMTMVSFTISAVAITGGAAAFQQHRSWMMPRPTAGHGHLPAALSAAVMPPLEDALPDAIVQAYQGVAAGANPMAVDIDAATSHLQAKLAAANAATAAAAAASTTPSAFNAVNDFLSAAQTQFDLTSAAAAAAGSTMASTTAAATTDPTVAPMLADYLKDAIHDMTGKIDTTSMLPPPTAIATAANIPTATNSNMETIIANDPNNGVPNMMDYLLTHASPQSYHHPTFTFDTSNWQEILTTNTIATYQQYNSWLFAGSAFLIMIGQKQLGYESGQRKSIQKFEQQVSSVLELAESMQTMTNEIQTLRQETQQLRNEIETTNNNIQLITKTNLRERNHLAYQLMSTRRRYYRLKTKSEHIEATKLRVEMKLALRQKEQQELSHQLIQLTQRVKQQIQAITTEQNESLQQPQMSNHVMMRPDQNLSFSSSSNIYFAEPREREVVSLPHFALAK